ncbi:MAG: hypothetical protein VX341_05315 [Bdellovibrionota bacterium]|nr:hypothetical protein [Bdellovibrionota bacterium]
MAKMIRTINQKSMASIKRIDNFTVVKLELVMIGLMTVWFFAHNS